MPTTVRSSRRTASASASAWHARLILAVLALCLTGTAWIASATATTATQRHVSLASDEGFVSARSTLPSSIWATESGGYNGARFESAVEDDERPESASFPQASLSFPAAPSKVSPQVSIGDDVNAVELDVLRQSVRSAISRGCSEVACSLLGEADTEQRQQPPTADSIVEIVPVARNSRGGFQLDLTPADKQYFRERYQYDVDELHALFAQSPEFTVDERALGEGSFGIVYSARRRRTGESKTELLAVKLLRMDTLVHVGHDVVMANKIIESMRGRPNDAEHLVLPRDMFWIVAGGQRRQLAMVFDHME